MAKQTKRGLLIRACEACGWQELVTRSTKFRQFYRPEVDRVYLIGKSGALRCRHEGEPCSASVSLTGNRLYAALLQIGNPAFKFADNNEAKRALASLMNSQAMPKTSPTG